MATGVPVAFFYFKAVSYSALLDGGRYRYIETLVLSNNVYSQALVKEYVSEWERYVRII